MKFGLRTKYTLLLAALTLSASLLIGTIFLFQIYNTVHDISASRIDVINSAQAVELRKRGHDLTGLLSASLSDPLQSGRLNEIETVVQGAIKVNDVVRISVYDNKAHLLRSSGNAAANLAYPAPAEIQSQVLDRGQWLVASNKINSVFTAPVKQDGRVLGAVSITIGDNLAGSSVNIMHQTLDQLWSAARIRFLTAAVVMLLLFLISSVAIGHFAARRISQPIEVLAAAAKRIGEGQYDFSLPLKRKDEIGELGATLGRMTNDLKKTTVSMKYLDDIIGNMHEGLIVASHSGRIDKINRAACELSGYEESALIGQPTEKILSIPPATDGANVDAAPETSRKTSTLETRDGKKIAVLVSQTSLKSLGGDKPGTVYVFNDISEIKQREAELKSARDEAMIANRSKSQFLATMSHELRTPLNAIIGFSSMLKDQIGGPLSEKYQSYAVDIYESADHLLMIINDLLDISKLEAGKMELMEEPVELSETVYASIRLIGEKARAKGITIKTVGVDDVPALFADKRMIKQMVTNLLSNAYKFNQEGGAITINAALEPSGGLDLSVKDTGIGISPEDMGRITLPFSQVENHISRNYQGTGLGLAITKQMMELHGGSLLIESEKGKGTKVTLRFPAACVEA